MKYFTGSSKKLNSSQLLLFTIALLCLLQFSCGNPFGLSDRVYRISIKDFNVVNENEAWLVKQNGKVLAFDKNGTTAKSDFSEKITQIYFLNANEGWALEENGQLWATSNNGKDWQRKAFLAEETPAQFSRQLIFVDKEVGWLIGSFTVWMTQDGGSSWKMVYPTSQIGYDTLQGLPASISVASSDVTWIGFEKGGILKTDNRGISWQPIKAPAKIDVNALYAFDADNCVMAGSGEKGGLFYTSDGGKTWKDAATPELSHKLGIFSISFIDKKIGWAAGENFVRDINNPEIDIDVLLKTTDGGKTWVKVETNTHEKLGLFKVKFTDKNNGWLTGERNIYQTRDGGNSWTKIFEVEDFN